MIHAGRDEKGVGVEAAGANFTGLSNEISQASGVSAPRVSSRKRSVVDLLMSGVSVRRTCDKVEPADEELVREDMVVGRMLVQFRKVACTAEPAQRRAVMRAVELGQVRRFLELQKEEQVVKVKCAHMQPTHASSSMLLQARTGLALLAYSAICRERNTKLTGCWCSLSSSQGCRHRSGQNAGTTDRDVFNRDGSQSRGLFAKMLISCDALSTGSPRQSRLRFTPQRIIYWTTCSSESLSLVCEMH